MAESIIALIVAAIQAIILVVTEIFEEKKRAREAQEKYELDKAKTLEKFEKALARIRTQAAKETSQTGSIEDQLDKELGGKK